MYSKKNTQHQTHTHTRTHYFSSSGNRETIKCKINKLMNEWINEWMMPICSIFSVMDGGVM